VFVTVSPQHAAFASGSQQLTWTAGAQQPAVRSSSAGWVPAGCVVFRTLLVASVMASILLIREM